MIATDGSSGYSVIREINTSFNGKDGIKIMIIFKRKYVKELDRVEQEIEELTRYIKLEEQIKDTSSDSKFRLECMKNIIDAELKLMSLNIREDELIRKIYF